MQAIRARCFDLAPRCSPADAIAQRRPQRARSACGLSGCAPDQRGIGGPAGAGSTPGIGREGSGLPGRHRRMRAAIGRAGRWVSSAVSAPPLHMSMRQWARLLREWANSPALGPARIARGRFGGRSGRRSAEKSAGSGRLAKMHPRRSPPCIRVYLRRVATDLSSQGQ